MKVMKFLAKVLIVVISGLAAVILVSSIIYSPTYMARFILWNFSDIKDYEKFPGREITNAPPAFHFPVDLKEDELKNTLTTCTFTADGVTYTIGDLDRFLADNDTTAFIVIQRDAIIYEKYFNGYTRDSINTSFSVAKSFTSTLIGIAIDEGLIEGVDAPVVDYLPELKGNGLDALTIRQLLMMSSGLKYVEGDLWWTDDPLNYYSPDLRRLAIEKTIVEEAPGIHFHYNNYHPQYLGMILERASGMSVSGYLEKTIWTKIGTEYGASWSTDSEKSGFEHMESCLNARSIDFAKFGRLFLKGGTWEGTQVISEKWVEESTQPEAPPTPDYYTGVKRWSDEVFQDGGGGYYKYFWWGFRNADGTYDYYARGHLGQVIYICPTKDLIIVRNGSSGGVAGNWGVVCRAIAQKM